MESQQELVHLASRIYDCETQGHALSDGWYEFKQVDVQDALRLKQCSSESLQLLTRLSQQLDGQLHTHSGGNPTFQHAYNIVQELIQSRTASQEMLENILKHDDVGPQEYFRALSLKEKAAMDQAKKLRDTLSSVH